MPLIADTSSDGTVELWVTGIVAGIAFLLWGIAEYRRNRKQMAWALGAVVVIIAVVVGTMVIGANRRVAEQQREEAERQRKMEADKSAEQARLAKLSPAELATARARIIEGALQSYKTEHGSYPSAGQLWDALTRDNKANGPGKFLDAAQENPLNHSSVVGERLFGKPGDGWQYDSRTGQIRPVGGVDAWPAGVPLTMPAQ